MTTDHSRDDRNDVELIRAANRGDPSAFETLYRRHRDWVAALALRMTGERQDALDVLQETFVYLWGKFPGFTLSASSLRGFLYPVVKHESLTVIRRRRRQAPLDLASVPEPAAPPLADDAFEDTLQDLPREHREVARMRFALDMRLDEIAEALGIPVGTVKSRLHNVLKQLRLSHRPKKGEGQ